MANQDTLSFNGLRRREILAGAAGLLAAGTLPAQDNFKFRIVAQGLKAPESPKPLADGSVVLVEMARGTLSQVMPDGKIRMVADLGPSPNGCAVGPDGFIYVTNSGGLNFEPQGDLLIFVNRRPTDPPRIPSIQKVNLKTGDHTVLYKELNGGPLPGANDLVFDRNGGFYVSGGGAVMYAETDGSMIRKLADVPRTNGIALSPDHKHLYVAAGTDIVAFEVAGAGSFVAGPDGKAKATVIGGIKTGSFDSMAAEADGGLVIGTLSPGALSAFSANGKLRNSVPLPPEEFVTSVGFGGPGLKTAYATLTQTGKLAAVEWPRAGLRLVHQ